MAISKPGRPKQKQHFFLSFDSLIVYVPIMSLEGNMEKQFTATVYIVDGNKVLLLFHPKLGKWLPPGGHIEEGETPPECAIRETFEETGLRIAIIRDEHVWVSKWNAESFERPWLCLLENVPAHGQHHAHQHIDFIYLARPIGGTTTDQHHEQNAIRWFSIEDVLQLPPDQEIFAETQEVIQKIFAFTCV